jgi:hypothetical protein
LLTPFPQRIGALRTLLDKLHALYAELALPTPAEFSE